MADLVKTPGHTDLLQVKNQEHVDKIIPERVYMFLSLLFEGMDILVGIAIILMGKRELIALLNLSSWCLVMVERLFLVVPRDCLQFVIVVFPDHTHYFWWITCWNPDAIMAIKTSYMVCQTQSDQHQSI